MTNDHYVPTLCHNGVFGRRVHWVTVESGLRHPLPDLNNVSFTAKS
jgi:hypothetical protein